MKTKLMNKMKMDTKYSFVLAITVLLFCTSSCAAWQAESPKPSSAKTVTEKGDVKIYRDFRYGDTPKGIGQDTSSDRTLDLYMPVKKANEKLPVFMFVHGGGFAGGDKEAKGNEALCLKMAAHGFAVVSINYYLTLKHEKTAGASATANMSKGIPANGFHPKLQEAIINASDDAQLALKWIKNNANNYGLDLSSVAVSGGSAGAMTVLYLAYASNQQALPIKAVVDFWGGLENSSIIKKGAPALLVYHGELDKTINVDFAYDLEKQMKKIGNNQSETHILKGKGHAAYSYITAQKTDEIAAFLRKVLK